MEILTEYEIDSYLESLKIPYVERAEYVTYFLAHISDGGLENQMMRVAHYISELREFEEDLKEIEEQFR